MQVVCSSFQDNRAIWGGALFNDTDYGTVQVNFSAFVNNSASSGQGGAVYNRSSVLLDASSNFWSLLPGADGVFGAVNVFPRLGAALAMNDPLCLAQVPPVPQQIAVPTATSTPAIILVTNTPFYPTVTPLPAPTQPSGYNVFLLQIDNNGNQTAIANNFSTAVFVGVQKTALALRAWTHIWERFGDLDVSGAAAFREIMTGDGDQPFPDILSADPDDAVITFVFDAQFSVNCQTFNVGGNPANITGIPQSVRNAISNSTLSNRVHQAVIVCGTSIGGLFDEYTVVHELGHVFDGMAVNGALTQGIANTTTVPILDSPTPCNSAVPYPCPSTGTSRSLIVMGNVRSSTGVTWIRGDRGWGSAPPQSAAQLTLFQKNFIGQPPYQNLFGAQQETAADMFLNWVYRTVDPNGGTSSLLNPTVPGNWLGFLNRSWIINDPRWGSCGTGCDDYSLPGDARFSWMIGFIVGQFNSKGW